MTAEYINFDPFSKEYDFTRAMFDASLQDGFDSFLEVNKLADEYKNVLEIGFGIECIIKIFALNSINVSGAEIT